MFTNNNISNGAHSYQLFIIFLLRGVIQNKETIKIDVN